MDNDSNMSRFESVKQKTNHYNLKCKVIVLGDKGVGKSCICIRQEKSTFANDYISTKNYKDYNCDLKYKDLSIKLDLVDTNGSEDFIPIIKLLYKDASLAIIVYSIEE